MKRKKLLICILLFPVIGFSQLKEYGLKLGVTSTQSDFYNPNTTISRSGNWGNSIYAQIYAEVYHYKNFSLLTGTGILELNSIANYRIPSLSNPLDSIDVSEAFTTRSFFIDLESKIKVRLEETPKLTPYFLFGPQLAFLNKQSSSIDLKLKPFQVNVLVGIGFDYDFKKATAFLEWQRFLNSNENLSETANGKFNQKYYVICIGIKYIIQTSNPSK